MPMFRSRKAAVFLIAACGAFCGGTADAAAYINPVHITAMNARDAGFDIYVDASQNPDGCQAGGPMRIASGTQNRSDLIATALTAFALGKPVSAYLNGCSNDGVPLAYTIWIESS